METANGGVNFPGTGLGYTHSTQPLIRYSRFPVVYVALGQGGVNGRSLWRPPPQLCVREPSVMRTKPLLCVRRALLCVINGLFFRASFFFRKKNGLKFENLAQKNEI